MSVSERRAEIIRILFSFTQTKIPNLARELKSSVSTIKRDILALTVDEGYPIDTMQGNGGGVIMRSFKHPHMHILSQEQIKVLTELAEIVDPHYAEVLRGILRAYA